MAHFAKIDENNVVQEVLVVPDEQEHRGQEYLAEDLGFGGIWIQTSRNTQGGVYLDSETYEPTLDQSKAFRKNFAGPGYIYDEQRDAFIPPKIFPSWILNEQTCWWEPPIPMPETGGPWIWNEELGEWEEFIFEDE